MDDQKESEVGVEDVLALSVNYQTDKTPLIIDFYPQDRMLRRFYAEVGITGDGIGWTDGSQRSSWGVASTLRG